MPPSDIDGIARQCDNERNTIDRLRNTLFTLFCGVFVLGWLLTAVEFDATALTATQAKDHAAETATVCGMVASATFAARSKGAPTFLNLDKPYPNHIFTAVIWGRDRPKFHQPEALYLGKRLCVTGNIKIFRGCPEIIVTELSQINPASAAR